MPKSSLAKNLELLRAFDTSFSCLPIPQVEAGDAGEEEFFKKVEPYIRRSDSFIVMNRLLPSRGGEIDFIILTKKKIHLVEVKNWSGVLVQDPQDEDRWIRFKRFTREEGLLKYEQRMETRNQLKVMDEKKERLKQYLFKATGLDIPNEVFKTWVVFMNGRNFSLDEELYMKKNVITLNNLLYTMGRELTEGMTDRLARMILESLIKLCLREDEEEIQRVKKVLWDEMPQSERSAIQKALEELPTWDYVELKGGRELRGEILEFYLEGKRINLEALRKKISRARTFYRGGTLGKLGIVVGALFGKEDLFVPKLRFFYREASKMEHRRAHGKLIMEAVADLYSELEEFVHLKLLKERRGNNGIIELPFYMMRELKLSPVPPSFRV